MTQTQGFSKGFSNFFKAIPFIFKHGLWWVFIIPLILNIALYISGFELMDYFGDWMNTLIHNWFTNPTDSWFMSILPGFLAGMAKLIMQIIFFFAFAYFSGYVLLIILSPLFAWLSEKTDQLVNGNNYPFEWKQFFKDIWRGIILAVRNLLLETGISVFLFIVTFIPVIGQVISPLSAIFLFLLSSYFYGFSFMDYTGERKRFKVKERVQIIRKNKGMAIANGALFSLSLIIPFCGTTLAGFSAIVATVGATMAMNGLPEVQSRIIQKSER